MKTEIFKKEFFFLNIWSLGCKYIKKLSQFFFFYFRSKSY